MKIRTQNQKLRFIKTEEYFKIENDMGPGHGVQVEASKEHYFIGLELSADLVILPKSLATAFGESLSNNSKD